MRIAGLSLTALPAHYLNPVDADCFSNLEIVEMIRMFLPAVSNEARLVDQIDTYITKAVELQFLRRAKHQEQLYEVQRIIKAYVDGQWLADFETNLARYAAPTTPEGQQ